MTFHRFIVSIFFCICLRSQIVHHKMCGGLHFGETDEEIKSNRVEKKEGGGEKSESLLSIRTSKLKYFNASFFCFTNFIEKL